MIIIYKIVNPCGKVYIGQTCDFKKRIRSYKTHRVKPQRKVFNSLVKYGFENHAISVVHEIPADASQVIVDAYEQLYMDLYINCGVELLNIKEAGCRGKASEETKSLMSKANKGKCFRKNWKPTQEQRLKMSMAKTGKVASRETKEKISKSLTGRTLTPAQKAIAVKNLSNKKGKIFTEEHRRALSVALTGKKLSKERIEAMKSALKGRPAWNKGLKGKYKLNKDENKIKWL